MAEPDHQVTSLWRCHTRKIGHATVQLARALIGVIESGAGVEQMHKVRAVGFWMNIGTGAQNKISQSLTLIRREQLQIRAITGTRASRLSEKCGPEAKLQRCEFECPSHAANSDSAIV